MKLQRTTPRKNWQQLVESQGLLYHTQPNTKAPYWVEDIFISLNPPELENLKSVINSLHSLCLSAIPSILESRDTLSHYFQLPEIFHEYFISSWIHHQNNDGMDTLYGRFDLAFDENNVPKMLEYNADTPTSLIEAAVVQREWALDCFNGDSKQWNQIEDSLISTWSKLHSRYSRLRLDRTENMVDRLPQNRCKLHTSCIKSHMEDYQTTRYIEYTASEAGWDTGFIYIEDVGWNDDKKTFVDLNEDEIQSWFKLYPWEWLLKESFGQNLLSVCSV
ncbi:hypothetical protein BKA69DRAFT_643339 [Paraphysoderma sedebokerense]|nr:hypothetical protein BKA69DRAFT_643339 [Paraphysoderma sedebokerense]